MTTNETNRSCAVGHVGVSVPDLDEAIGWYCDVLGCRLLTAPGRLQADGSYPGRAAAEVFGPSFGSVRMAHLITANGVALELFEFEAPRMAPRATEADYWTPGFSHICIVDPDIEGRVAAIRDSGGKVRTGIWAVFEGRPFRFCHCEDPFGNIIELYTHSHEQVYGDP